MNLFPAATTGGAQHFDQVTLVNTLVRVIVAKSGKTHAGKRRATDRLAIVSQ